MEFNIEIDHDIRHDCPIRYDCSEVKDKSIIYVGGFICVDCDADWTEPFLPQMLEHEITEILCNKIRYDDGEKIINNKGFDQLTLKWHYKTEKHICGDTTNSMWSG